MRFSTQSRHGLAIAKTCGIIRFALGMVAVALNLAFIQSSGAGLFTNVGVMNIARSGQTATLLPNGKVLVAGVDASAELYDPGTGQWTITGSMAIARYNHTAALLPNGKVLVAGGTTDTYAILSSVEVYDPATGNWSATGPLNVARENHTMTSLPDGKILVAAGDDGTNHLASAEIYDPVAGTWSNTGYLAGARAYHTATSLHDGRVLVAGGGYPIFAAIATAELYDEATGTWTNTGAMTTAREFHSATLLPNGQVLVAGGTTAQFPPIGSAELYDPATGNWTSTGSLNFERDSQTASLLPNGKVLVAGGEAVNDLEQSSSEIYDPASGTWTVDSSLSVARVGATATLLAGGDVLVTGGYNSFIGSVGQAELYDRGIGPTTGTWTNTNPTAVARYWHTATLLANGTVLAAGGYFDGLTAELYDPSNGSWTMTSNMVSEHAQFTANLLPGGEVLIAGGFDGSNATSIAELYNPTNGSWTQTGSMSTEREAHTATLLPNGKVLVTGGVIADPPTSGNLIQLTNTEIYDPAAGTWTASGIMNTNRSWHTTTLLANGKVLAVGGGILSDPDGITTTAELYDPATGSWTFTGSMATARYGHTAMLLPNGNVLVAGGTTSDFSELSSAELYDPVTGAWTATSNAMAFPRFAPTATLMPDGKVLIAGGYDGEAEATLGSGELYDPATQTWTLIDDLMSETRYLHTATLLPDGTLLITGGASDAPFTSEIPLIDVELYNAGLGSSNLWQPQISMVTSPLSMGKSLTVNGTGFRGISGASSGMGQDSSSDYPLVQLRSLESGESFFLLATNWSTNSFMSAPVTNFPPGYALVTAFVNGIPGTSAVVNVSVPVPTATVLKNPLRLANGSFQFAFTNTPGALFGVLATTNAALPLTNWTALGGVLEVAPGQFQFTDAQATNNPRQFYRVRVP